MTRTYIVPKMMCNGCVKNIDRGLSHVKDISYSINLSEKTVEVFFNGNVDDDKVIAAIAKVGYQASRL